MKDKNRRAMYAKKQIRVVRDIPDDWQLTDVDYEVESLKDMLAGKNKNDFDGFFTKQKNGEIIGAYGFSGGVPYNDQPVEKVETAEEHLKKYFANKR